MTDSRRDAVDAETRAWQCEQMVNGHADAATRSAWLAAVAQEPALKTTFSEQHRMHRLLAVALARPTGQTVAAHAIRLAANARHSQRQHAVRTIVQRWRRHRRRPLVATAAAAAAVLVATLLIWNHASYPALATAPVNVGFAIDVAEGTVLRDGGGHIIHAHTVALDAELHADGPWRLRSSDGLVDIELTGNSYLRVLDDRVVAVERGLATIAVQPGVDPPWRFPTPHADLRILGTRFVVTVEATRSRLAVIAGSVVFQPHGHDAVIVTAGSSAQAEDPRSLIWQALPERTHVEGWTAGSLRSLTGPFGRSAFHATALPRAWGTHAIGVAFAAGDVELVVTPQRARILADVWLPLSGDGTLTVQGWDRRAGHNVQAVLRDLPRGQWIAIEVPIADFRPVAPEAAPPSERPLQTVMFVADGDDPTQFWVTRARIFLP